MNYFVGIDLGTTNSAICSYDGAETRIWKSPEQNDVTPSALYIDRRGNKYVGKRAYDSAPNSPDNSAMLFKRLMGTSTPVTLSAVNITKTPEECSAEVLKTLFGYLPEEIRNDSNIGTVITVPAAFNQMQKDATMQAADMAGIGKVALMQEPVAAVMSVMRIRKTDGTFLIYDLGGGTLDIAIAESIGGRVNLLSHGGIAMCGGRDFDRALVDNIVKPWLIENFNLPDNFAVNPDYKSLMRLANWATERSKIELSAKEETVISLSESEARAKDLDGEEIYIDIPLLRETFDTLIAERIDESINSAREALMKAGLTPHDLERVVFIGGPTNYKPLRDKVAFELGIPGGTDVNPMTAVAEGASIFAESIDWTSDKRSRKKARGQITSASQLGLSFVYIARTPDDKAKLGVNATGTINPGFEFQVDNADTGWTSGRLDLKHGLAIDLSLTKSGENTFKVCVFDPTGTPVSLEKDVILISRTAATIDSIPASHSIACEVLDKLGGRSVLDYLVNEGESLPKHGKKVFKAAEPLRAGDASSLNFKLWEGEIEDPISDNRPIGNFKISGADFDSGVIPAGADLECDYVVSDSGNISFEVSVPCIGGIFHSEQSFYSRQEGQLNYTAAAAIISEESEKTLHRIDEISEVVASPKLEKARRKINLSSTLGADETESSQEAMENIYDAKKLLAEVRKENLKEIRQIDLDRIVKFFNEDLLEHASPSEASSFSNLSKTAQTSIDTNSDDFESHFDQLMRKGFEILWRQDWFVTQKFKSMVSTPHLFTDSDRFEELVQAGIKMVKTDDIDNLRGVIFELSQIQIGSSSESEMLDMANIFRG